MVISIIEGWNWYAGSSQDGPGITAGEYDYQTVVTHELAHAVGLFHDVASYGALNDDGHSVMYPSLDSGQVRRQFSAHDIAWLDHVYATGVNPGSDGDPVETTEALYAAGFGPLAEPAPAPVRSLPGSVAAPGLGARIVQPAMPLAVVGVFPSMIPASLASGIVHAAPVAFIGPVGGAREIADAPGFVGGPRQIVIGGLDSGRGDTLPAAEAPNDGAFDELTPGRDIELLPAPAPVTSNEATAEMAGLPAAIDACFADDLWLADLDSSLTEVRLRVTPATEAGPGAGIVSESAGSANPPAALVGIGLALSGYGIAPRGPRRRTRYVKLG